MSYCIVLTTILEKHVAINIAKNLVDDKIAACVNIVQNVLSVYEWKNEICEEKEFLLIIKTKSEFFKKIENIILSLSEYEVPEIIEIPIIQGYEQYLNWIDNVISKNK